MTESSDFFSLTGDVEVCESRGQFDRALVEEAWEAAEVIEGNDAGLWRRDENGSMICKSEYGSRVSSFGWDISEGTELKPLHIENF